MTTTREPDTIEVPENDYQPTKAELEEPIRVDLPEGVTFEDAVRHVLRPVNVRRISAEEHRRRHPKE